MPRWFDTWSTWLVERTAQYRSVSRDRDFYRVQAHEWASMALRRSHQQPSRLSAQDLRAELVRRKRILRHLDNNSEEGTVINNFLVGCDPEFVALDGKGQLINVSDVVQAAGEVGYDHSGRVLELRPSPARGTYALTKRLQVLLRDNRLQQVLALGAKKFRAGAVVGSVTLGGHVHFGFPRVTNAIFQKKIDACDRVTQTLEALDILPTNESQERRNDGEFGQFGATRPSDGHTEYRTMASWLYDPRVAYLCLTAAKLAASDPAGALEALKGVTSFGGLTRWFERYKGKDANATRAVDNVLSLGHKTLVVDPNLDFRTRWERLGL